MSNFYPELSQKILDMADGDDEFRMELTAAIHSGLLELKAVYSTARDTQDEVAIQQIRHKLKPTLAMFEFDQLAATLQNGKEILDSEGFGASFEAHFEVFLQHVETALEEVQNLRD